MTSLVSALSSPEKVPTRSIVLLAVAGFASQAMVRVTDSLLPQIAIDFGTTVGEASIVVAAYAVGHGAIQLIIGPFGDRFGKYRTVATMCALATILVALCGTVQSLSALAVARFASGVFGWREVFFVLAAMFALATAGLVFELMTNPRTRAAPHATETRGGFVADYAAVLSNPWARFVILAVFIEAAVGWGAFAYVGADLHLRFSLTFGAIGLIVGTFGLGGLLYAASVSLLVNRFGQAGLAQFGGVLLGLAYLTLAVGGSATLAPVAVTAIGLGFYALHNTLQTNATQMTPEARGTAVAIFSSAIYLGQTLGVTAGAVVFDRFTAARP